MGIMNDGQIKHINNNNNLYYMTDEDDDSDSINTDKECDTNVDDDDSTLEDLGSELSEESYDYDSETN